MRYRSLLPLGLFAFSALGYGQTVSLLNGKDLTGWQVVGDGIWSVMSDGTLAGQRNHFAPKAAKDPDQSWLYTTKEFGQFDLHLEWWLNYSGNSGVSIRDTSRGRYSQGPETDPNRTPSHIGYEIQISNHYPDHYPTGSIYHFVQAKTGYQIPNDWNSFDIESRTDSIRVKLNGHLVAEYPGDPKRSKTGPIGLQLHDRNAVVLFRNIRIREIH
jgi:hypothetical protein